MKISIDRFTMVSNTLVFDTKAINYDKLMESFELEGIDFQEEINSENFDEFLKNNEHQLFLIFDVIRDSGYSELGPDSFSDESDYVLNFSE